MRQLVILLSLVCFASAAAAQGRAEPADHPLISPYEGSDLRRKNVLEFDEYFAFMGVDEATGEPKGLELEGKITKLFYAKPKERSILEVFRNYESAIAATGADVLFSCNQEKTECAKRYAGPTMQKASDIHAILNLAGRYLLARLEQGENTAYIAIAVGPSFTDVHVVEVRNMESGKVVLDAEALGQGLDAVGYVIVEGIFFDTDKATLKAESSAALQQVATLLEERPDLKVHVVGHTDMVGELNYNIGLSERRADSVVRELVAAFGVSQDRMTGHGVGPLAPKASNADDSGRALNRRVVLVAR